ncbi:MAG: hypothetical protein HY298_20685 [Verrucomicrobia bacterium]|nr:hypothetical protein [Verrucomicrobiota bacterium]
MKLRYRLFQRNNGIFFIEDRVTRKQESLRTKLKEAARRIFNARNEAHQQPAINLQIARAYLMVSDPHAATRTWQHVMTEMAKTKKGATRARWERAMREKPFDFIRDTKLIETQSEHFLRILSIGTISTNVFLRRLHNFAFGMDWIVKAIIPKTQWPKIDIREKRGVTLQEHRRILAGERNAEWRAYYNVLWHVGGSQSDIANLCAEDVNWDDNVIS